MLHRAMKGGSMNNRVVVQINGAAVGAAAEATV
jgi:hypothetical protein